MEGKRMRRRQGKKENEKARKEREREDKKGRERMKKKEKKDRKEKYLDRIVSELRLKRIAEIVVGSRNRIFVQF